MKLWILVVFVLATSRTFATDPLCDPEPATPACVQTYLNLAFDDFVNFDCPTLGDDSCTVDEVCLFNAYMNFLASVQAIDAACRPVYCACATQACRNAKLKEWCKQVGIAYINFLATIHGNPNDPCDGCCDSIQVEHIADDLRVAALVKRCDATGLFAGVSVMDLAASAR